MPTLATADAILIANLIIAQDDKRPADHDFKLQVRLRKDVESRRDAVTGSDPTTAQAEGDRADSSATARQAYVTLERLLGAGYKGIEALPDADLIPGGIEDAERLRVFTVYGWESGLVGRYNDARLRNLGDLALAAEKAIENPAWRYSPLLLGAIKTQLDVLEVEEPRATTGSRQIAVEAREEDVEALRKAISRVRHFYCSASDDVDFTKELASIGMQPRRMPGDVRNGTSQDGNGAGNGNGAETSAAALPA